MKIMTICTIDVHARDVVAKMILVKVEVTSYIFMALFIGGFEQMFSRKNVIIFKYFKNTPNGWSNKA